MAEKRAKERDRDASSDPLGKPLARYSTNGRSVMLVVVAVVLGLSGAATLGGAEALAWRLADSTDGTPYVIVGWALMLAGAGTVAWGVYYYGRSFEVRRKGVRFSRRGSVTELRWDQIEHIEVQRTIILYRGRPTGRYRWEIFICGWDTIHLTPSFLQLVRSVTELVSILKVQSGRPIDIPPLDLPSLLY
jgi:hypothetical protein